LGVLSVFLAVAFGATAIYTDFLRNPRPDLRFEAITDTNLLDVRESLGDLQILYGGVDIQRTRQSLRVVVVRVINVGRQDILRGSYDERSPLGFRVSNGSLLRVEPAGASNDYIRQNLKITTNEKGASFSPLIIESQEWFAVKCIILHPETGRPSIQPEGKVAGVRNITFVSATDAATNQGIFVKSFSGSPSSQAVRFFGYGMAFFAFVISTIFAGISVEEFLEKRARRANVVKFKAVTTRPLNDQDAVVFDLYMSGGIPELYTLQSLAKMSAEDLARQLAQSDKSSSRFAATHEPDAIFVDETGHTIVFEAKGPRLPYVGSLPMNRLKSSGVLSLRDGTWTFDEHVKHTLAAFQQFVGANRKKRKKKE